MILNRPLYTKTIVMDKFVSFKHRNEENLWSIQKNKHLQNKLQRGSLNIQEQNQ